jgi:hypothetical protein
MLLSRLKSPVPEAPSMSMRRKSFTRFVSLVGAALALFFAVTLTPGEAEARGRWGRRGWFGGGIHGWFVGPPIWFHFHRRYEAPPQPAPVPYYGYGYPQAPPPPPPPVAVQPAYRYPEYNPLHMGLSVAGLVEAPHTGQLPMGGVAGALQFRTSSHSMISFELQSMGARRTSDDLRRSDLAGLVSGRIFLWNFALAPYLELGGGLGRASMRANDLEVRAMQLVGRLGLGLELRLGRHVVLDGQVAQLHRLAFDELDSSAFEPHERASVVRGGVSIRF